MRGLAYGILLVATCATGCERERATPVAKVADQAKPTPVSKKITAEALCYDGSASHCLVTLEAIEGAYFRRMYWDESDTAFLADTKPLLEAACKADKNSIACTRYGLAATTRNELEARNIDQDDQRCYDGSYDHCIEVGLPALGCSEGHEASCLVDNSAENCPDDWVACLWSGHRIYADDVQTTAVRARMKSIGVDYPR